MGKSPWSRVSNLSKAVEDAGLRRYRSESEKQVAFKPGGTAGVRSVPLEGRIFLLKFEVKKGEVCKGIFKQQTPT